MIDTFRILTNQDFYILLEDVYNVKNKSVLAGVPFPPSSHASRASCAPEIIFPFPIERLHFELTVENFRLYIVHVVVLTETF